MQNNIFKNNTSVGKNRKTHAKKIKNKKGKIGKSLKAIKRTLVMKQHWVKMT
jgi:hypothetical protein